MHKLVSTLTFIILLGSSLLANPSSKQVADNFWETGKIYVVVAVVLTIFIGIIFFLFYLERRITSLEKDI